MTTDEIRALEPRARRRLEPFRDCFKKSPVFDYFVYYSLGLLAQFQRKSIEPIACGIGRVRAFTAGYVPVCIRWSGAVEAKSLPL